MHTDARTSEDIVTSVAHLDGQAIRFTPAENGEPTFRWTGSHVTVHMPRKWTARAFAQFDSGQLSNAALVLEAHAQAVSSAPSRYGLVLKPSPHTFVNTAIHASQGLCLPHPDWLTSGNSFAWFAPTADPAVPETLYLSATMRNATENYREPADIDVIWQVQQVGLDDHGSTFLEAAWNDSAAVKDLAQLVHANDGEAITIHRTLTDSATVHDYITKRDFWSAYLRLWEELKPRRTRVRGKMIKNIAEQVCRSGVAFESVKLGSLIGLGNCCPPKNLDRGWISRRNIGVPLTLQSRSTWLYDVSQKEFDTTLHHTRVKIANELAAAGEGTLVRVNTADATVTRRIAPTYVVSDPILFARLYNYATIPLDYTFPSHIDAFSSEPASCDQLNPVTGEWEPVTP